MTNETMDKKTMTARELWAAGFYPALGCFLGAAVAAGALAAWWILAWAW